MDDRTVIKLYEVYESSEKLYLVTEVLRGGELFKKIKGKDIFDEEYCAKLLKKILKALKYVH